MFNNINSGDDGNTTDSNIVETRQKSNRGRLSRIIKKLWDKRLPTSSSAGNDDHEDTDTNILYQGPYRDSSGEQFFYLENGKRLLPSLLVAGVREGKSHPTTTNEERGKSHR